MRYPGSLLPSHSYKSSQRYFKTQRESHYSICINCVNSSNELRLSEMIAMSLHQVCNTF